MSAHTLTRDAFVDAIDAVTRWEEGEPEPHVEAEGDTLMVSALCRRLWRCRDLMPNRVINLLRDLADDLGLPPSGPTYAAGARLLRRAVALG